ncbi:MAG TPA: DUF1214 domain-containing protein [Acidimicrobiales bacterium]
MGRDEQVTESTTPATKPGSSFGPTGVPSSADIGARLRAMAADSDVVLDQHVVDHFCDQIRQAAVMLSDLDLTAKGHDRTASYHYLLAMVMYSIDAAVLGDEPLQPMWSAPYQIHRVDWGAANPDAVYRRTWISEDLAYRVHGQLGNADCFLLEFRRSKPSVLFNREDLGAAPDGTFELFVGGPERDSNWTPMPSGAVGLSVREFFNDWMGARRSRLRIDCLDGRLAPRPDASPARVADAFDLSADWVLGGAIEFWIRQSRKVAEAHPNAFVPELARAETPLPVVTHAWWDLDDDEALVIEFDDPQAQYWGIQLATSLWSTLEYANRMTSLNRTQAHQDDDGKYRLVLSHRDPGVHNWLDTTGLHCGIPILRQYRANDRQIPTTRVVKVDDVPTVLAGTRLSTPSERHALIAERRDGVARLVSD